MAALNGHLEVVKLLVAAGANLKATLITGDTPCDLAAQGGHPEVAESLRKAQSHSQ
jgi:ankyrin repeat protein